MTDIFALQQAMPVVVFGLSSRYASIPTATIVFDGRTIVYVRRRFLPQPESLAVIAEPVVTQGDRLDHLAARYLGDPELFWRICDANRAMRPEELTEEIGRRLAITLPDGVPGMPNA
jgi:hypothetical protein